MVRERTFCMIKPGGVSRGLIGEVVSRIEKIKLRIIAMKMMKLSRKLAETNYAIHKGKPFYKDLIDHVTSGPVVCMVVEGNNAVKVMRKLIGATDPKKADKGTIRGDLAEGTTKNVIHASDTIEAAKTEIPLFFSKKELMD